MSHKPLVYTTTTEMKNIVTQSIPPHLILCITHLQLPILCCVMERGPTPAVCHNFTTVEEEPAENLGMASASRKVHGSGTVVVPVRQADVCKVPLHRNETDPVYGALTDNHSGSKDVRRLIQMQEIVKCLYNIKRVITDCLSSS